MRTHPDIAPLWILWHPRIAHNVAMRVLSKYRGAFDLFLPCDSKFESEYERFYEEAHEYAFGAEDAPKPDAGGRVR